jgi:hypothetical protein
LGFIGFMISFHSSVTSGLKLSLEDKGHLVFDAFGALSNLIGKVITQNYLALVNLTTKNPDFEKGADNAAVCAFYSIGKVNEEGRMFVEQAKKMAEAQGEAGDRSAVVVWLLQILYVRPLRDRFDRLG